MSKGFVLTTGLLLLATASSLADAQRPAGTIYKGRLFVANANRAPKSAQITLQLWNLEKGDDSPQTLPISGFVVVNLRSGQVETTINGVSEVRVPEDFWTLKAGSTMQIKVLGQSAMLETLIVKP